MYYFQIENRKLQWNASSKIGSLENAHHKPKGGDKKIETVKLDFKDKAKPKIGSKDNIKHQPGGGDVKVSYVCKAITRLRVHESLKSIITAKSHVTVCMWYIIYNFV